jgi:hypothetical protein
MKITVLGTGCYKCLELERLLSEALVELGLTDSVVDRISDERAIRRFMPIDAIPGIVIDGRLVQSGTVPTKDQLRDWLTATTRRPLATDH